MDTLPPGIDPSSLARYLPMDKTIGSYLLGTFIGLTLYGISLNQLCKYIRLFPSDDRLIRTLVTLVMILETVYTAMTMHSCIHWMVSHHSDIGALIKGIWSFSVLPVFTSTTVFCSQLFFARRVFLIGPKFRPIAVIAMLCIVTHFSFGIAMMRPLFVARRIDAVAENDWRGSAGLAMILLADLIFTIILTAVLRRSRAGLKRNDSISELAIVYIINTGFLHCFFNALSVIFIFALPLSLVYMASSMIAVRLYANTLLCVLNSREALVNKRIEFIQDQDSLYPLNLIARANRQATAETWNVPQVPETRPTVIDVKVTTEQEGWGDLESRSKKKIGANEQNGDLI